MRIAAAAVAAAHAAFVAFVALAPFSKTPAARVGYLIVAPVLWVHWALGDSTCALTLLEARLRGLDDHRESFLHRLVAPVYDIPDGWLRAGSWAFTVLAWVHAARRTTWDEVRDVLGV